MLVDAVVQELGEDIAGMVYLCFIPGTSAGKAWISGLTWDWGLELSGNFVAHMSDTWPGITWRLTQPRLSTGASMCRFQGVSQCFISRKQMFQENQMEASWPFVNSPCKSHSITSNIVYWSKPSQAYWDSRGGDLGPSTFFPPWGIARWCCRRTRGTGDVFAAIFGKYSLPRKGWGCEILWTYNLVGEKTEHMSRWSRNDKINKFQGSYLPLF